mmetsp:Transcript_5443/g.7077  ORF Transcript_5443/g.7077 Transcript_5443/m.7077 type:complete len:143 (+) Transcript_5443:53-481(+)
MEAPHDATKSKDDLMNFSGSASDMLAAMQAAGIVMPDAKEAALQVAAAPASAPKECDDPNCGHDHSHEGHSHDHDHKCEKDDCHDHSHSHEHSHKSDDKEQVKDSGHDHDHDHKMKEASKDDKSHHHDHDHEQKDTKKARTD